VGEYDDDDDDGDDYDDDDDDAERIQMSRDIKERRPFSRFFRA